MRKFETEEEPVEKRMVKTLAKKNRNVSLKASRRSSEIVKKRTPQRVQKQFEDDITEKKYLKRKLVV